MNLSLSNMLGGGSLTLDPDARAYIAAVETAGGTVSATQRTAVSDFYRAGKSAGWYSSIKRLYLPIWAAAAPNAIDMIGLTSGTFNGTVTHSAGYVEGDGTTGYFDLTTSPSLLGLTTSSGSLFSLMTNSPNTNGSGCIGIFENINTSCLVGAATQSSIRADYTNSTSGQGRINGGTSTDGILLYSRTIGDRSIYKRNTSSFSTIVSVTGGDFGSVPTANLIAMAVDFTTNKWLNTARFGAWGVSLGLDSGYSESFTLALKNLWETCTSLSLP